jgi:hypothetical protein
MKVGFPPMTGSIGLLAATRPSLRFDPNGVVHGFVQPLFAPQVAFGGLNAHMTQQELNLLKLSARHVAEPRTGAPQVVRPQLVKVQELYERPTGWVFTSQIRCSSPSSGVECSLENARTP